MNHDDAQIDAALEALARPEPPADHVAQVLARTVGRGAPLRRPVSLRPRWILPIAATLFVTAGLAWQVGRMPVALPDAQAARSASGPYQPQVWGAPNEIDRPVLPPQAYWGMDAFTEFERLHPGARTRSGTQDRRKSGTQGRSTGSQGRRGGDEGAEAAAWATVTARAESWPDEPTLPAIELEPIVPASLVMTPLAPLENIVLAEIPLAPIAIDALIEEERP